MVFGASLLNENARAIFEILCKYPCSCSTVLHDEYSIDPRTIADQLESLSDDKLVVREKYNKNVVNYPNGFLRKDLLGIYCFLNGVHGYPLRREIFKAILEQPGISTMELVDKLETNRHTLLDQVKRLVSTGYFYIEKMGQKRMYFPDYGRFRELQDFHTNRRFQENFLGHIKRAIFDQYNIKFYYKKPTITMGKIDEGKPTERERIIVTHIRSQSIELTVYQNPIGLIAGDLSLFSKKRVALAPLE